MPLRKGLGIMSGVYDIPAAISAARGVTNTPPTTPYRSAGRPEAMFIIERLIDLAADQLRLRSRRAAPPQFHPAARCPIQSARRHL